MNSGISQFNRHEFSNVFIVNPESINSFFKNLIVNIQKLKADD